MAFWLSGSLACAGPSSRVSAPATAVPDAHRSPPGVVQVPLSRLPPPAAEGATANGVLVLHAPEDTARIRATITRFFAAAVEEDLDALRALLSPDAMALDAQQGREIPALPTWSARFARLDYSQLGGRVLLYPSEVSVFRGRAALALAAERGELGLTLAAEAVLVQVPIVTPRVGSVELFSEEMWFVLMPGKNGYRISWLIERPRHR